MSLKRIIPIFLAGMFLVGFISCQTNDEPLFEGNQNPNEGNVEEIKIEPIEKDSAMTKFAQILSKASFEDKDVREFLKNEASKRFDGHTDILYSEVKEVNINGKSFQDILASYSSLEEMLCIDKSVPLLNIYLPEITALDVTLDNMDCNDAEIPVAIYKDNGMNLFLNGKFEITIPKGELPAFHSFVINENERVSIKNDEAGHYIGYEVDPSVVSPMLTRSSSYSSYSEVGYKAVKAFDYFYKDDGSNNSRALQRDYIYYGITPTNGNGSLNNGVNEYIGFMEVDPKAYFDISDQTKLENDANNDPYIVNNSVSRKKKDYTQEELISEMWAGGNFSFRFEIYSSNRSQPTTVVIDLSPDDIWNFNYDRQYRHSTKFRHSKYTYTINPRKFTSKRVDLSTNGISFGKWDLSQEALERYVAVYEVDKAASYEFSSTSEMNVMTSAKVNGNVKFGLGTNIGATGEIGTEINTSTTRKETKTFTVRRTEEDDALGMIKIYFYDPIILSRSSNGYEVNTYNTGIVKFGLYVR